MSLENKKWIPRFCSGSDLKKEALFLAQSAPIKDDPTPTRPTVAPTKRPTVVTDDEVTNKPTAATEDNNTIGPTVIPDIETNRPTAPTTLEDEPAEPTPSK